MSVSITVKRYNNTYRIIGASHTLDDIKALGYWDKFNDIKTVFETKSDGMYGMYPKYDNDVIKELSLPHGNSFVLDIDTVHDSMRKVMINNRHKPFDDYMNNKKK